MSCKRASVYSRRAETRVITLFILSWEHARWWLNFFFFSHSACLWTAPKVPGVLIWGLQIIIASNRICKYGIREWWRSTECGGRKKKRNEERRDRSKLDDECSGRHASRGQWAPGGCEARESQVHVHSRLRDGSRQPQEGEIGRASPQTLPLLNSTYP